MLYGLQSNASARFCGLLLGAALLGCLLPCENAAAQSMRLSASDLTSASIDSVDSLVRRANQAFAENRIVSPSGNNALELFVAASTVDRNHAGVKEGLVDLYPLVVAAIEHAIAERRLDDAIHTLDLLDRALPDSIAAKNLRSKVVGQPATRMARADQRQPAILRVASQ